MRLALDFPIHSALTKISFVYQCLQSNFVTLQVESFSDFYVILRCQQQQKDG